MARRRQIPGTDSCFSTKPTPLVLSTSAISVFSFPWQTDTLHGSYQVDSLVRIPSFLGQLLSLEPHQGDRVPFCSARAISSRPVAPVHSAFRRHRHPLPPFSLSPLRLYLLRGGHWHSGPQGDRCRIKRTTLFQLSLFFDLLLATCLERGVYLNNEVGEEKIDRQQALRHDARLIIWERLHRVDSVLGTPACPPVIPPL